jgi:hypothetical protein
LRSLWRRKLWHLREALPSATYCSRRRSRWRRWSERRLPWRIVRPCAHSLGEAPGETTGRFAINAEQQATSAQSSSRSCRLGRLRRCCLSRTPNARLLRLTSRASIAFVRLSDVRRHRHEHDRCDQALGCREGESHVSLPSYPNGTKKFQVTSINFQPPLRGRAMMPFASTRNPSAAVRSPRRKRMNTTTYSSIHRASNEVAEQ